ncbi:unnamed protein product [Pylaiella littoralis]
MYVRVFFLFFDASVEKFISSVGETNTQCEILLPAVLAWLGVAWHGLAGLGCAGLDYHLARATRLFTVPAGAVGAAAAGAADSFELRLHTHPLFSLFLALFISILLYDSRSSHFRSAMLGGVSSKVCVPLIYHSTSSGFSDLPKRLLFVEVYL